MYVVFATLIVDLLITATRAAVLNARSARIESLGGEANQGRTKTLELLKKRRSLRDSLRLALALLRFLMAGLVLNELISNSQNAPTLFNLISLILIGLVIWLAEFFVERRIARNPEVWALRLSSVAAMISLLVSPVLFVLNRITRGEESQLLTITEAELKSLVDVGQRQGVLEQEERRMIFSIFKFSDTLVREIMVPRIDIFALDVDTPIQEAGDALIESGYSRVPVYKGSVDSIQGLLYGKDLLKVWRGHGDDFKSLSQLLRPAHFVPESKKLDDLLQEMQGQRIHMSVVVDEYGGVAGLVTLEDLVEEIIGEIQDEYDLGEEQSFQKVNEGEYIFHGRIPLDQFNEIMGTRFSTENADTLGGYLFSQLGRVPKSGEQIKENGLAFTIEQISGRRIRRVRVQRVETSAAKERKKTRAKQN